MNLDSKNNKVKFGSEIKKIEVYLPGKNFEKFYT